MKKEKNKILFVLLCFSNVMLGQMQTKTDTILCLGKNVIVEYPSISRTNIVNYEEGYFKTINSILDTVVMSIHCGRMVNLPLTNMADKTISSTFVLGDDIRSMRGYSILKGRKKYFREDNYFKYGITIAYENVEERDLIYYEYFFNDIKIW